LPTKEKSKKKGDTSSDGEFDSSSGSSSSDYLTSSDDDSSSDEEAKKGKKNTPAKQGAGKGLEVSKTQKKYQQDRRTDMTANSPDVMLSKKIVADMNGSASKHDEMVRRK
jgi:hypothetical protein